MAIVGIHFRVFSFDLPFLEFVDGHRSMTLHATIKRISLRKKDDISTKNTGACDLFVGHQIHPVYLRESAPLGDDNSIAYYFRCFPQHTRCPAVCLSARCSV